MKRQRQRFEPVEAEKVEQAGAVVYKYTRNGEPCAIAYVRNRTRREWHLRFRSAEAREAEIGRFLARTAADASVREEHAAIRRAGHHYKVGWEGVPIMIAETSDLYNAQRDDARAALKRMQLDPHGDYFTLRAYEVENLLEEADRWEYRKPANANGSRARYFHAMLKRRALRQG